MKYTDLQHRLKPYQAAGLVKVRLNQHKSILEIEYQRCLQLGLSQKELKAQTAIVNYQHLNLISPFEIYTLPNKFPLKVIKAKTYQLSETKNLVELKSAFPLLKDKKYDFRTKKTWSECVYLIDSLTKDIQEFKKFQQEISTFINAIEQKKYHQLRGELAVEEAVDDLASHISWWKGAQWEHTLSDRATTLDLLKRAWLEQYLTQHNLGNLLKYTPID